MKRRHFLYGVAGATTLVGTATAAAPAGVAQASPPGAPAGPPVITPDDIRFPAVSRRLRPGTARQAGLLAEHVGRIADEAAAFMEPGPGRPLPSHPGFALMAVRDSVIVAHEARGHAVRYASWDDVRKTPVELPPEQRVPMATGTLFDLASVTKLFTSTVATQLYEQGVVDLDAPVASYLPEFARSDPAKAAITLRRLLTHRSGLVSWINLYTLPDDEARMTAIFTSKLVSTPGSKYEYSDLNMITLAEVLKRVTGRSLDVLIAERITGPLGMTRTMFNPPEELLPQIAATEYQPWTGRGMVRGTVHDENAFALGGVAGHAGIFSTARDLAVFGQMLCDGGQYADARVLSQDTVRDVLTNYNADIGASPRGLGWQVDQRFYMDALNSPVTAGHTGYTGTCITVDPVSRMVLVLLTNRVHPTRDYGTDSAYRRAPARAFARALAVRPATGRTAWFAGMTDGTTSSLVAPLRTPTAAGLAGFRLWYDTESPSDIGAFDASTDGGATWTAAPLTLRAKDHRTWNTDGTFHGYSGRQWLAAAAPLTPGTTHIRWTYRLDAGYQGRGVYVDRIRVTDEGRPVFNGDHPADAARIEVNGWAQSED